MKALSERINAHPHSDYFIVVADADNSVGVGANAGVTVWDAAITIAA